jgi:hypothetical protein
MTIPSRLSPRTVDLDDRGRLTITGGRLYLAEDAKIEARVFLKPPFAVLWLGPQFSLQLEVAQLDQIVEAIAEARQAAQIPVNPTATLAGDGEAAF